MLPISNLSRIWSPDDDDDPPDFLYSDHWSQAGGGGYGGEYRYNCPVFGEAVATWTFDDLVPGNRYEIVITWPEWLLALAPDVPCSVYDGDVLTGELLDTFIIDQSQSPGTHLILGDRWLTLGEYVPASDTLSIRVTNDIAISTHYILADAVCLIGTENGVGSLCLPKRTGIASRTKTPDPFLPILSPDVWYASSVPSVRTYAGRQQRL